MSARDLGYFTGAFVGLLIAVILIWIFKKLRKGSCKQYDERQNLAKGKAFRAAFLSTILLLAIYACFIYGFTKDIVSPQLVMIIITFIGLAVYCVYCIFSDAYFYVGQNPKPWLWFIGLATVFNGVVAFKSMDWSLNDNGFVGSGMVNLVVAVLLAAVFVSVVIKLLIDKKEAANEES